ncbi:MAG: serine hydrolase [Clostridia bacterium]|nr:serine hydrolase [Clostridia bacterium]
MDFTACTERAQELRALGILVTRKGEEILEWYAEPECRRNVYSASKSFTSAAVGFAVQEGLLSLDEPLLDAFAGEGPENPDAHLQKAVVRDLLTMHLGQAAASLMGDQRIHMQEDDWVRYSLAQPFSEDPGEKFLYNNVGPYLAGVLVQRRAGCNLQDYLYPRLFKPLGIRKPTWEMDPVGYTFGAGGLFLGITELHKFGLLYLAGGAWEGKQLLRASWIEESTRDYRDSGYGYLFWRGKYDSYRADGKYGQFCIVLPQKESVITVVSECRDTRSLIHLLYDEICAKL